MAAIAPVTADFRLGTGAKVSLGTAGEAIDAFELLYLKSSDNKYWLAVNSSEEAANATGIAVQSAAVDEPVAYVPLTKGVYIKSASALWTDLDVYIVGDTAGQMMDAADAGAADYVTIVGVADGTQLLQITGHSTGIT